MLDPVLDVSLGVHPDVGIAGQHAEGDVAAGVGAEVEAEAMDAGMGTAGMGAEVEVEAEAMDAGSELNSESDPLGLLRDSVYMSRQSSVGENMDQYIHGPGNEDEGRCKTEFPEGADGD